MAANQARANTFPRIISPIPAPAPAPPPPLGPKFLTHFKDSDEWGEGGTLSILPPPWGDDAATADSALFSSILVSRGIPPLLLPPLPTPEASTGEKRRRVGFWRHFSHFFTTTRGGGGKRKREELSREEERRRGTGKVMLLPMVCLNKVVFPFTFESQLRIW